MSRSAILIASPIPRVPPVTIATRAMRILLLIVAARLGGWEPAFKFALDQLFEHGDAFRRVIEAFEHGEVVSAGGEEGLAAADAELLEGFEAIGGEAGRGDGDAPDSIASIAGEHLVGRGLEPFRAPETRLERDVDLASHRLRQQPGGFEAMIVIRIAQLARPFRHAMEAQKELFRLEIQRSELSSQVRS